jgi:hypothetical protein
METVLLESAISMLKVANSSLSLSCAVKSTLTENVMGYSQITLRVSLTSNLGEVYE